MFSYSGGGDGRTGVEITILIFGVAYSKILIKQSSSFVMTM